MGAKPIIAPPSASATIMASRGSAPIKPNSTRPAVTGTTSATVIQSMPSMKLVRLTNQSMARPSSARSSQEGRNGMARNSSGSAASTIATATACKTSRGITAIERTSSIAPTTAMKTVAARTSHTECPLKPGAPNQNRYDDDADRRCDHRDSAALRCRRFVRRARIGVGEGVTPKQRTQQPAASRN